MNRLLLALFLLCIFNGQSRADPLVTTDQLNTACTSDARNAECLSYISGVTDQVSRLDELAQVFAKAQSQVQPGGNPKPACLIASIPATVKPGQLKDIIVTYLKGNPGNGQFPAAATVDWALSGAFPCPH